MRSILRLPFKTLGLIDVSPDGEGVILNWPRLALAVILVKGALIPGWITVAELALVLGFGAYRWTFEPKQTARMSKDEAEKLRQELDYVKGELASFKLTFGFSPNQKFSMFSQKRG